MCTLIFGNLCVIVPSSGRPQGKKFSLTFLGNLSSLVSLPFYHDHKSKFFGIKMTTRKKIVAKKINSFKLIRSW